MSSRRFWFEMAEAATGETLKGSRADAVSLPEDSLVVDFRSAAKAENSNLLKGVPPSNILVFKNRAAFDKRNDGEEPLEEDALVNGLGRSKKEALIVVVPNLSSGMLSLFM